MLNNRVRSLRPYYKLFRLTHTNIYQKKQNENIYHGAKTTTKKKAMN